MENEKIKSGIYKITNLVNFKFYIGSACNIKMRWNEHKHELSKNKHDNDYLQKSVNKYGIENFKFEVIEFIEDKLKLIVREQFFLDLYKSYDRNNGYNICKKAGSQLGFKHSDDTKKQISQSLQGEKNYFYGKHHGKKIKELISRSWNINKKQRQLNISKARGGKSFLVYNANTKQFIGEWDIQNQCANDLNINGPKLHLCLKNKRFTHKNYIFIYKDQFSEELLDKKINDYKHRTEIKRDHRLKLSKAGGGKPFRVFEKSTGKLVGEYIMQTDCAKELGMFKSKISACLKGKSKSTKGYIFKYKGEENSVQK